MNSYPQFLAEVDGTTVHFVHLKRGGTPLILTHGWPSSFLEYLPLAERLESFDLGAQQFYQRCGFGLVDRRIGAVDECRRLYKPEIPAEMHDEYVFERRID